MDSSPVNWEALDSLVMDFAKSDNLVEDLPSSPASPSSSSTIRWSLETGNVDRTIDLLRQHAPAVLEDHRLLFRLQKQKFIELLRKGTAGARQSAIECLRKALAPCALDAYPEAYEEFKHALLALIYDKEDENSPVANEWSEKRRFDTAGLLSSILRAHLHSYDPVFSMTLRYLIRLLFEDRDPPGIPQEILYEAPPFDEVDIQALAHAVELTRQGAIDSLKFAKGNLYQAFQVSLIHSSVEHADDKEHKYEIILELRELASKGLSAEVVDEINAMDPDFFLHNPILLFQLKQAEFLKYVSDGDHSRALGVACSYLGPLTLFTLLKPNEDAMSKCIPFPPLQHLYRFGIEEPQLMKIMRATLHSHNEWFRLQMCSDRFEGFLKIDCLKNVDSFFSHLTSKFDTENCTVGSQFSVSSSNKMVDDGSSPVSVSSDNVICTENAILKVMEFLALPRADAIHLLMQYNGNAETVIQQIFQ
ncbi:unnamed protein product [Spirodela intermedia]|uniref:CTLH domain-containing protein n=1 Tax=Spirodela intermedia TaxID=51605 RepID=A0A7I8J437_SPIIN|nr:unnamed protein product [Spirodela intermedia]CAA6664987.1 unnamed protein product [Spirodela intermedia]